MCTCNCNFSMMNINNNNNNNNNNGAQLVFQFSRLWPEWWPTDQISQFHQYLAGYIKGLPLLCRRTMLVQWLLGSLLFSSVVYFVVSQVLCICMYTYIHLYFACNCCIVS